MDIPLLRVLMTSCDFVFFRPGLIKVLVGCSSLTLGFKVLEGWDCLSHSLLYGRHPAVSATM